MSERVEQVILTKRCLNVLNRLSLQKVSERFEQVIPGKKLSERFEQVIIAKDVKM